MSGGGGGGSGELVKGEQSVWRQSNCRLQMMPPLLGGQTDADGGDSPSCPHIPNHTLAPLHGEQPQVRPPIRWRTARPSSNPNGPPPPFVYNARPVGRCPCRIGGRLSIWIGHSEALSQSFFLRGCPLRGGHKRVRGGLGPKGASNVSSTKALKLRTREILLKHAT